MVNRYGVWIALLASACSGDAVPRPAVPAPAAHYAVAIATANGFAYLDRQAAPSSAEQTLSKTCSPLSGDVTQALSGTQVELYRLSSHKGDAFFVDTRGDGQFEICVPPGSYLIRLFGAMRAVGTLVEVPVASRLRISGAPAADVLRAPRILRPAASSASGIVAEIVERDAHLIGLGEASHGTAEFASERGAFVLELARHAELGAVFLENDAIAVAALDDYIQGRDVDIGRAVTAMGFWITDTHEFLKFLADLRAANAGSPNPVRLWGIDVQNVELPVRLLPANAALLRIAKPDQAVLEQVGHHRGRPVQQLSTLQRSRLDRLLARLSTPRTARVTDLRLAIAARSMAIQIGYWQGDAIGQYGARRDAGMAALTQFILVQTKPTRAAVWGTMHTSRGARPVGSPASACTWPAPASATTSSDSSSSAAAPERGTWPARSG